MRSLSASPRSSSPNSRISPCPLWAGSICKHAAVGAVGLVARPATMIQTEAGDDARAVAGIGSSLLRLALALTWSRA